MNPKPVTVIMRTKNSAWVIREALAALFSQTYQDFDLLVVDSGSEDRTLEFLGQFPHRLIEIEAGSYFPGKVLNMAVEEVDSDLIVVQNSDSIPQTPTSLANLLDPFCRRKVAATYARQVPRDDALPWVRRDYHESFPTANPAPPWIRMSFPFAAFRRSIWDEHHFYVDAWASEDQEWAVWAKSQGYEVAYVPDSIVMHSHNYSLGQLYGRRFVEGEAEAFFGDDQPTVKRAILRAMSAAAKDVAFYIRERDFLGIPGIPLRRTVEQWAFQRGLKHGLERRRSADNDASIGQQIVLKHHSERNPRSPSNES